MTVLSSTHPGTATAPMTAGPALLLAGDADLTWEPLAAWVGPQLQVPPGWPSDRLTAWLQGQASSPGDPPPAAGGVAAPGQAGAERLAQALQALPGARLVYFVARPEFRLLSGAGRGPAEILEDWTRAARSLLRLAHGHPGRCLFVDIEDAWAHPDELAETLADWLECARQAPADGAQAPSPATTPATDAAGLLLARAALAEHIVAADLAAELHDSAVPLGPITVAASSGMAAFTAAHPAPTAQAALEAWQASRLADATLQVRMAELQRAHEALAEERLQQDLERRRLVEEQRLLTEARDQVTADRDARLAEIQALQAERRQQAQDHEQQGLQIRSLDQALTGLQASIAEMERRTVVAEDEIGLLTLQLAHALDDNDQIAADRDTRLQAMAAQLTQTEGDLAQGQRECSELQHQLQDVARAQAALEWQLESLLETQQRLRSLQGEHAELQDRCSRAESSAAALSAELQTLRDELASRQVAVQADLESLSILRAEREDLIAQLYTARTDATTAQALAWAAAPDPAEAPRRLPVSLGGLSLVTVRDETPHREVQFRLLELLTPHGELPQLDLRLVEHHGRPGLVIFQSGSSTEAVSNWRQTGEEGGKAYMLLVPADDGSRRHLNHMAAADWQFIGELAALMSMAVTEPDFGLAPHWRHIATRLERQLAQLPPRLRYDKLDVDASAAPGEPCRVRFGACSFGAQRLPAIELSWRPDGAHDTTPGGCALAWALPGDPDEAPALAHWPVQDDGRLQPLMPLPVGPGWTSTARRAWWSRLAGSDRELVLSVLDALPAAADVAARPAWRAAAQSLHRDARRTLSSQTLRHVARKLLRRPAPAA